MLLRKHSLSLSNQVRPTSDSEHHPYTAQVQDTITQSYAPATAATSFALLVRSPFCPSNGEAMLVAKGHPGGGVVSKKLTSPGLSPHEPLYFRGHCHRLRSRAAQTHVVRPPS